MHFKVRIRNWLLENPNYNPFRYKHLGFFNLVTSPFRIMPNFMIIGAARCGTTSLFDYLTQHPNIIASKEKEPGYFATRYKMPILWYKAHFPTIFSRKFNHGTNKNRLQVGEASTIYLLHPETPKRIRKELNGNKFLVLLRDPVDRAYSNYHFQVKRKRESRTFRDVIMTEIQSIKEKKMRLETEDDVERLAYTCLKPGIYVEQLRNWFNYFPRDRFFIIETEEFNKNTQLVLQQVFDFLNVERLEIGDLKQKNVGRYGQMDPDIRRLLTEFYRPYNKELFKLLGQEFKWQS